MSTAERIEKLEKDRADDNAEWDRIINALEKQNEDMRAELDHHDVALATLAEQIKNLTK